MSKKPHFFLEKRPSCLALENYVTNHASVHNTVNKCFLFYVWFTIRFLKMIFLNFKHLYSIIIMQFMSIRVYLLEVYPPRLFHWFFFIFLVWKWGAGINIKFCIRHLNVMSCISQSLKVFLVKTLIIYFLFYVYATYVMWWVCLNPKIILLLFNIYPPFLSILTTRGITNTCLTISLLLIINAHHPQIQFKGIIFCCKFEGAVVF